MWMRQGILIAVYLDDGLGARKNFYIAKRHNALSFTRIYWSVAL